jgi:hypothetical protein
MNQDLMKFITPLAIILILFVVFVVILMNMGGDFDSSMGAIINIFN